MSVFLALVGLPLTLALPGLSTVAALAPLRRLDWLERAYLALAISLALSGWIGLVLAQFGVFSLGLLLGLLAAYTLVLGLIAWRHDRWRWPRPEGPSESNWVLLAFLAMTILFGLLAFRPFELILGPRDAATYPATGAQIAQHGSIVIQDPLLPTLSEATPAETHRLWVQFVGVQSAGRFYHHYLRMPAFFVADEAQGTVIPQFYHLYPTWLATAFSLVGIRAGLLMTPYLSLLGGIGVFLAARRLFGARSALLAYLFLVLQTLQVWFARYSTAEGATQFLVFLGIYGLLRLEDSDDARTEPFFGLLAGVALGLIGLVRADFIFPWLLLLPYLVYLYVGRRLRRGHHVMLLVGAVLVLHTLVQIVTHTRGYTLNLYYHRIQDWATTSWLAYPLLTPAMQEYFWGPTPRTWVLQQPWRLVAELAAITLVAGLLFGLRRFTALAERIGGWLQRHKRLLLTLAAALLALVFAYLYLVRPGILTGDVLRNPLENRLALEGYIGAPVPEGPAANMVRLGWYFSPLGIALGLAGAIGLLRAANRRSWFLLLLGFFYLFFFTYEVFGDDHHVYIMRRYVPVVVPFLCIAMAYALDRLSQVRRLRAWGKVLAGGVAALMAVYLAWTGLPFYQHTEYRGALDQLEGLAERFGPDDVILLIDDARDAPATIATPLQYLLDRNAFLIYANPPDGDRIEEQIRRWQAQGRDVYLLIGNDGGRLFLPHTRLRWLDRFELSVPEFESLTAQKPHNAYILRQPFGIYAPTPWEGPGSPLGNLPLRVDLGSEGYIYQADGFYSDEVDPDGSTYCWTKGEGVLRLPWPDEGIVTITLRLAGGIRPTDLGPAQVQVLAGEQSMGSWLLEEGFTTHSVTLPAQQVPPDANGTIRVSLFSPVWRQIDHDLGTDTRPLGIQVDWVMIEVGSDR